MRPNWRNADEYPSVETTSPRVWAWEFLRRNPKYTQDWAEFRSKIGEYADRYANLSPQEKASFLVDKRYQHVEEIRSPTGQHRKIETPLANWYGRKWGLAQIADPGTDHNQLTHRWIDMAGVLVFPNDGFDFADPRYMAIAIDLSRSLDDQLDQVREHYKIESEKRIQTGLIESFEKKRRRFESYRDYLRVLDGYESGTKRGELAAVLLPHIENSKGNGWLASKSVDNWRKEAEQLSMQGYRALLLIPER
ncbi:MULTISPECIES: transcriptional regulator domain-containing protein [Burkholderia]|uniref:transcriptional regulator domain-containing protein n=1 Tax=Burkholderia TaxID=32008 RepID=UPI000B7A09CA|nr:MULTISPECIES: DUF6499 domain-containing protein [Burkholderia]OXJ00036.1 hypothetical protein CFB41_12595 [Burkholderia sp. AU33803]PRD90675.1 DUF2285 domain-containing protein [Burkholderia contaminans]